MPGCRGSRGSEIPSSLTLARPSEIKRTRFPKPVNRLSVYVSPGFTFDLTCLNTSILIILQILRHTRHAIRFCPKAREEERLCHDIAKEYLRGRDTQYISDHF